MIEIDLVFVPADRVDADDVAIVVDVLRMTTTATVLFSRHLHELTVIADADHATRWAERTGSLLFGERGGLPLPGFDGGNSPIDRLHDELSGRSAILCTTNGSRAVEAASGARHVLLGAVVNAGAVARQAVALAAGNVTLVCAGTNGAPSLDDVLGAGCIIAEIRDLEPEAVITDAARMAFLISANAAGVPATLSESKHARTLVGLGFREDVAFAARLNALDVVAQSDTDIPTRFRRADQGRSAGPPNRRAAASRR